MESCLSSSIESKICTKGIINKFFLNSWVFFLFAKLMVFSLDEYNTAKINFYEMNIL